MKNSTLFVGLALLAGTAIAGNAQEVIRGIKITPDGAAPEARYYYHISNMRAQRLNYSTGVVAGFDWDEGVADWEDPFMTDNAAKNMLPLFLPNGYPEDWEDGMTADDLIDYDESDYKLTPQPYTKPQMGLALVDGSFWLAYSAQSDVMDPSTVYWYFTKGSTNNSVRIHNAVIDGTVKRTSEVILGRKATGFDTTENNYQVVALEDLFADEGFEMALTEEQINSSFALSTSASVTTSSNNCLDMNNYITYNYTAQRVDENGDPYLNENDEPVELRYGFASVDRTWSPLRSNGSNENHLYNNGSVFFVNEQPTADALAAIKAYESVVAAAYREGAVKGAKAAYADAVTTLEGWKNVPALWKDATALQAIIDECANWTGEANEVVDLASQEVYIENAKKAAQGKLVKAAGLVGRGAVVTLQNTLAIRDAEDADDEDLAEEFQLGDAYLSAGCPGYYMNGVVEEADYNGVGAKLVADKNCEWELIPVAGTIDFLLYNPETKTYIRKYQDMLELAGGEDVCGEGANNFSWATTANADEAAPFHFVGCADPAEQRELSEANQIIVDDYALNTDITNNVWLESTLTTTTVNEETGEATTNSVKTSIHRTTSTYDYIFVNYGAENNRWYADSNTFHVGVVTEGGINEINAADTVKAQGIYDLQGRKVAKAGKGLYIINGVKTIVR